MGEIDLHEIVFLGVSAVLCVAGTLFFGDSSAYVRSRRKPVESKEFRRRIAVVLIVAGLFGLAMSVLRQMFLNDE